MQAFFVEKTNNASGYDGDEHGLAEKRQIIKKPQ
jgi:hypothetical protein